jgi:hypothetical protein
VLLDFIYGVPSGFGDGAALLLERQEMSVALSDYISVDSAQRAASLEFESKLGLQILISLTIGGSSLREIIYFDCCYKNMKSHSR